MHRISRFIRRKPSLSFAIAAYAFSWTFWIAALLLPRNAVSIVLYYAGSFGPWIAAMIVLKAQRRSLRTWLKGLFRWRYQPSWYLFAFGFPILLVAIASFIYWLMGYSLDFSLLPNRLVVYLPMLAFLILLGGGNEEPGWRGFWLPLLQKRYSPVLATALLGIVWAFWHLPILWANPDVASGAIDSRQTVFIASVTLVSIVTHAFWYTWLMNRTGSVLLCAILHASYNAANGLLFLVPDEVLRGRSYQLVLTLMTAVLMASVVGLLVATKGRLGASRNRALSSSHILAEGPKRNR